MRSSSDCGDLIAELLGDNIAVGNEPRPPASETDTYSSTPCDPAIGAWMIGRREGRNSAVIPSPPSPLGPAVRSHATSMACATPAIVAFARDAVAVAKMLLTKGTPASICKSRLLFIDLPPDLEPLRGCHENAGSIR